MTDATKIDHQRLMRHVQSHPYPLVFTTISGAHLYGFASPDSDFDLRGTHVLPLNSVVSLDPCCETVEKETIDEGFEIDLVTHDIAKFFRLMLKRNGYVLEQVFSPLVVHTTPEHQELKRIAADCITRRHAHHYLGFAATQWKLFSKQSPPRVKPLLYVYRVLLTGIFLMRTGIVESNLPNLNEFAKLSYLDELIDQKRSGPEKGTLETSNQEFYRSEYERLTRELERESEWSQLPPTHDAKSALNDLLVRLRLNPIGDC